MRTTSCATPQLTNNYWLEVAVYRLSPQGSESLPGTRGGKVTERCWVMAAVEVGVGIEIWVLSWMPATGKQLERKLVKPCALGTQT
jgi:hypothetical protein